jgi:hypothetical protein
MFSNHALQRTPPGALRSTFFFIVLSPLRSGHRCPALSLSLAVGRLHVMRTLLFIVLAVVAAGCGGTSHKQSAKPASGVSIRFLGYYPTNEHWLSGHVAQFSIANPHNHPVSLNFSVQTNLGSSAEKFFDDARCFAWTNLNANSTSYFAFFSTEGYYSGPTNAWPFPVVVIHKSHLDRAAPY